MVSMLDGFVTDQNLYNLKSVTPGSVLPRLYKRYYYDRFPNSL